MLFAFFWSPVYAEHLTENTFPHNISFQIYSTELDSLTDKKRNLMLDILHYPFLMPSSCYFVL